ncbi:hypothetical protein KP509_21G004900 [Ceratopteris richardii]|nr:hypothetical protein KP509_21G004900 [Ceratopteris richardii]
MCASPLAMVSSPLSFGIKSSGKDLWRSHLNRSQFYKYAQAVAPIRALDSNPYGTADRSDAASDENSHSENLENNKDFDGSYVGIHKVKPDDTSNSLGGGTSLLAEEMHGFVFGSNQESDAWDNVSVYAPVVRRYLSDNEERWMLWYSGKHRENEGESVNGSKEVTGLAISSNGVHWKRGKGGIDNSDQSADLVGEVLGCSDNWWAFDTLITRPSDVLIMSCLKSRATAGVYWMYYTGGCSEEVEILKPEKLPSDLPDFEYKDSNIIIRRTRPGLAMSHDGRSWARIECDHYSGALFDVGQEGEWDSLFIADPHVVFFTTDDLRLYYHSYDLKAGCFSIGYARSREGMKWVKFGKLIGGGPPGSFDELGVKSPQVIPNPIGEGFLMIYEGVAADGRTSFGLAQSKDGLSNWTRCSRGPVFTVADDPNAWDSHGIHNPCLVQMDGNEWRLYYQGIDSNGKAGFGMAVCADGTLLKFERCHSLHL